MKLTKEQRKISDTNRKKAGEYFGLVKHDGLVLHHIDQSLRHENVERYIQWNPEDLVVLTQSEHTRIHQSGKTLTKEVRKKVSVSVSNYYKSKDYVLPWCKRCLCVETKDEFDSCKKAELWLKSIGKASGHVRHVCEGYREKAGGYHWRYI